MELNLFPTSTYTHTPPLPSDLRRPDTPPFPTHTHTHTHLSDRADRVLPSQLLCKNNDRALGSTHRHCLFLRKHSHTHTHTHTHTAPIWRAQNARVGSPRSLHCITMQQWEVLRPPPSQTAANTGPLRPLADPAQTRTGSTLCARLLPSQC